MRKRVLSLFLVMTLALTSLLGCSKVYELPYYDELDEERGINEQIFYENDIDTKMGDPAVIQVTDEKDPYYGWYYLYGTGGLKSREGYPVYRSRDLDNWEYVDIAFMAETGSSATYGCWAPDVIYDEATDKYIMFASTYSILYPGNNRVNEKMPWRNAKPFVSREQRKKYWHYADWIYSTFQYQTGLEESDKEANEQTIATMKALIQERLAQLINPDGSYNFGVYISDNGIAGEEFVSVYTRGMIDKAIAAYEEVNWELSDKRELIAYIQMAMVKIWTIDIVEIEHNSSHQALTIAIADNPCGPFYQYTNEPGKVNKGTGLPYDPTKRTITLGEWFIAPEDIYPWITWHRSEYYEGVEEDIGTIPEHYEEDSNGNLVYIPEQTVLGQQLTKGAPRKNNDSKSAHNAEVQISFNDVSAFVDPVTGDKYLYICKHNNNPDKGWIFAIKIGDKNSSWTDDPMWETTTRLTRHSYYTTDELSAENWSRDDLDEWIWVNEGPFTVYNPESKLYYLTMSSNTLRQSTYNVHTAVGRSPLGPFRKLTKAEGGALLRTEMNWDHVAGAGHHTFIETQGQLWCVYQKHCDPSGNTYLQNGRSICADPVVWVYNDNGLLVPHLNGPTVSPQPVMGYDKIYDNIALDAVVTATNVAEGSNTHYLNDDVIRYHSWDEFLHDFETGNKKITTITITFDDYRIVRAIMIYNTWEYAYHFKSVDKVELDFKKTDKEGKEVTGTALIEDLKFDVERYVNTEYEDEEFMRPGGSAIAEFDELAVKQIRITFNNDKPIKIAEIKVLGK